MWKRANQGWARRPKWLLDRKPKATLSRHEVYESDFILSIYIGEDKEEHEFKAPNLAAAKIKALRIYERVLND